MKSISIFLLTLIASSAFGQPPLKIESKLSHTNSVSYDAKRIYLYDGDTVSVRDYRVTIMNKKGFDEYHYAIDNISSTRNELIVFKNETLYGINRERELITIGKNADQMIDSSYSFVAKKHLTLPMYFSSRWESNFKSIELNEEGLPKRINWKDSSDQSKIDIFVYYTNYSFEDREEMFDLSHQLDNFELYYYDVVRNETLRKQRFDKENNIDTARLYHADLYNKKQKSKGGLALREAEFNVLHFWFQDSEPSLKEALALSKTKLPDGVDLLMINPIDWDNSLEAEKAFKTYGIKSESHYLSKLLWRELRLPAFPSFIIFQNNKIVLSGTDYIRLKEFLLEKEAAGPPNINDTGNSN